MKIAIACDHAALNLKEAVRAHLEERGIPYRDFGIYKEGEKRDYPYASYYACGAIQSGECDLGIVMCGTGAGLACELVDVFLDTPFEGGRHARRVEEIMAIQDGALPEEPKQP